MNVISGGDPGRIALKRLIGRIFPGKGNSYADKVRTMFGSNLVGYWQLNEPSGTVAKDYSSTGANGTYGAAVTLAAAAGPGASMGLAPSFPGAANGNITFGAGALTALTNVLNADEITISMWFRMDTLAHWNDANAYTLFTLGIDANNRWVFQKNAANSLRIFTDRGGIVTSAARAATNELIWINLITSQSKSLNFLRFYFNGTQVGADQVLGGTYSGGSLTSGNTQMGSQNATQFWLGNIAHVVLAKVAATPAQVAQLAVAA